jgi:hypothetical protein
VGVALGACGETRRAPIRALELKQIRPENRVGVYLNERLVLHFSEPLDPLTVHRGSIRVRTADSTDARGRLEVDEDRLEFIPDAVLAFDLSDGGYLPDTTYFVELAGFPRVDGLRGRSGALLRENVRLEFRTAAVTQPREGFLFEDASPTRGARMRLATKTIGPLDPITLGFDEPIDPSTLFAEDFRLTRGRDTDAAALRARVVRNRDHGDASTLDAAQVELFPIELRLEPGKYVLEVGVPTLRLRDFGNHEPWLRRRALVFEVTENGVGTLQRDPTAEFVESFLETSTRSSEVALGYDGTALWSGNGRVELCWPAAAGDGRDDDVQLSGSETRRDVQAISTSITEGATCALDQAPGLLVLRSQARTQLHGTLRRDGAPKPVSDADDALLRTAATLTELLEELRRRNSDFTVLIAGGDLIIDGRVFSSTPLLLIAGGRIRVARKDALHAPQVYFRDQIFRRQPSKPYGADTDREPTPGLIRFVAPDNAFDVARPCEFELDQPLVNPLRRPLRVAVLSTSLPPFDRAARWFEGPQASFRSGAGSVRVRYLGEHAGGGSVQVDDPVALVQCPTLRLLIELEMPAVKADAGAADKWDPPWVDDVLIEYEPESARRGQ